MAFEIIDSVLHQYLFSLFAVTIYFITRLAFLMVAKLQYSEENSGFRQILQLISHLISYYSWPLAYSEPIPLGRGILCRRVLRT